MLKEKGDFMFYSYLFNITLLVSSITLWNLFVKNTKLSKCGYACLNLIFSILLIALIDNGIAMNNGSYKLNFSHIPITLLILSGHDWFSLLGVIVSSTYFIKDTGFFTDPYLSLLLYLMVVMLIALKVKKRDFTRCQNWMVANIFSISWMVVHAVMFYSADIVVSFVDLGFIGLNFLTSNIIYFLYKKIKYDENLFKRIKEESTIDFLTGTYNKRKFKDDFESLKKNPDITKLSVCIFDIDHFKTINDTYGHPFGDLVLKEMSKHLKNASPNVYRIGGEEFLILFADADDQLLRSASEYIRETISKETWRASGGEPVKITVSSGIASCDRSLFDKVDLVDEADKKLYLAKAMGRNQCQY